MYGHYRFFMIIVPILWACTRSVTGQTMILQCALGNPSLPWNLLIKSSLDKVNGAFAGASKLNKRLYCYSKDCYALETNTSSFIKDNLASIFVNDECAVSNGTTFSCVLLYRNLTLQNVLGNERTITHSGNDCIPASLPPSTTPMIISTTTDKGDEGSVTTNATVPTTTETPTSSVISPSNLEIAKDSSSFWMIVSIVLMVIIVILAIIIVGTCCHLHKIKKNRSPLTKNNNEQIEIPIINRNEEQDENEI